MKHTELSLTEFQNVCKKQVEYLDLVSNLQSFEMVKIKAKIKNLDIAREKNYKGKIYNIVLTDGYVEVKAQSELEIVKHIKNLDIIEAICFCQPQQDFNKESLTMCANIIAIKSLTNDERPTNIHYDAIFLKELNSQRNQFPRQNHKIQLSLIYSSSSSAQVQYDFLNALGEMKNEIKIEELRTRLNQYDDLLRTINSAQGNIIVIIRGGGDANDLNIFDHPEVLHKISHLNAYRVAGIGHSANHNLINTVVDFSATTPTAAGIHIKEQLLYNKKNNWAMSNLKKTNKALEEQIHHMQRQHDQMNERLINLPTENRHNYSPWLIGIIIILILIIAVK